MPRVAIIGSGLIGRAWAMVFARAGWEAALYDAVEGVADKALSLVAELSNHAPDTYVPPQCYVFIYAGLGERERAFEHQQLAYEDGASPFNYLFPGIRELYSRSAQHKKRLEQMRLIL